MKFIRKIWLPSIVLIFLFIAFHIQSITTVSTSALSGKTVIIDAGHGLPDSGAISQSGLKESEINLEISKLLQKQLEKVKVKVIMTRSDENSLSTNKQNNKRDDMQKRIQIRDKKNADLFVSIHLNHFSQSQYSGAQTFYCQSHPESKALAQCIQNKLIELVDPQNTREIKGSDSIFVIRNPKIPSVLVECGFLSNPEESELLSQKDYQKKIVWAIYCGICDYFKNEKAADTTIY